MKLVLVDDKIVQVLLFRIVAVDLDRIHVAALNTGIIGILIQGKLKAGGSMGMIFKFQTSPISI